MFIMKHLLLLILPFSMSLSDFNIHYSSKQKELIIFHAGSLSVPMKQIATEFEKRNPDVRVLLESAGSLVCARKVTELKKPCDIIASSDYYVINELLIPAYASWSIKFATNEIVIAYSSKSKYSSEINASNWFDVLQKKTSSIHDQIQIQILAVTELFSHSGWRKNITINPGWLKSFC